MEFLQPPTWREALEARVAEPEALPIWGGTDVMVELNFARKRPPALLDLTRVDELSRWSAEDGWFRIGAGVSYTRVIDELGAALPGLAMASRTVGSPQIRNRGTIGGNLGSSSPAGDALPPLFASRAEVELASARGSRRVPIDEFVVGPKRNVLAADELIAAVWVRKPTGPQQFAKVGTRNAMVIAVCSFALDLGSERVGTCIGSAGPTPIRALEAEEFADGAVVVERSRCGALRRAGGRGGVPDRRRARDGRVPAPRARGAGQAHADVGLEGTMRLSCTINGEPREVDGLWEGESLLYVLRERLQLPGSKNACEQGECGSCSVYLDGVLVCSCLVAAGQAEGRDVVTVEGLAPSEDELHPIQEAFLAAGAVQCGFCTPGLIVATHDLLARNASPSDAEIREALAGNLCRCTGYEKILDAVRRACISRGAVATVAGPVIATGT